MIRQTRAVAPAVGRRRKRLPAAFSGKEGRFVEKVGYRDLREFLGRLRREGELKEVGVPVDPRLELAEIHRRVIAEGGPALLFTRVKGGDFPVVTNLFGTRRRVELAFGPKPELIVGRIVEALETLVPPTPRRVWRQRGLIARLLRTGVRTVPASRASVLERCRTESPLQGLPALTCWPEDGGPFVTLPLVYTEHPETGRHNLGMYRMQVFDDATTGMHWQIHKGGGLHYHEAEKRGRSLPVTVFLGGPPALIAAAVAPLPESVPELMLASLLTGRRLSVARDPYGGHPLIAEAEFAICGEVPPFERRPEGPFGDHYGYYSLRHDFPVFRAHRMWHRKDAIYPATVVGKPPQEDYYLGEFLQRLLSPAFPLAMPGVRALWTYAETGFHPLAAAVVRESYAREALATAFRILGEGQLSLTKVLLVTDRPVDPADFDAMLEAVLERFDPARDLYVFDPTAHDTLDYTGPKLNHGSKAVLIGVGEPVRALPRTFGGPLLPGADAVRVYGPGCLVASGPTYTRDPAWADRLLEEAGEPLGDWPLVVLVDDARAAQDRTTFLWTVFTRFNPASDIRARGEWADHRRRYRTPIVVDARMKPGYPAELEPDEETVRLVDRRWKEYFA